MTVRKRARQEQRVFPFYYDAKTKQKRVPTKTRSRKRELAKKLVVEGVVRPTKANAVRAREQVIMISESITRAERTFGSGDFNYWREIEKSVWEHEKKYC